MKCTVGTLHIETTRINKDTFVQTCCVQVNNANRSSCNKNRIKKKTKMQSYCTYKTESVHNAHNNHTRLTHSAGSTFGSKLSDKLVQYIKQINTYIYSTYIENEG